jgi:Gram-negative bacterial TonB protein C-terminal
MWNFVLAPLLLAATPQSAPPTALDWTWDRTTPSCSLRQAYSDGKIVSISRTPGNEGTGLSFGGTVPITAQPQTFSDGKINFSSGETSGAEIHVSEAKGGRDVIVSSDDPDFLTKLAKTSDVELVQEAFGSMRVPLRSAGAAVKALRNCEDSKMRDWGMDPVAVNALKSRPSPVKSAVSWFSTDDYPIGAIFEGLEGYSISRLLVGPDGTVTECVSLNRNRRPHTRDRMCDKLKHRARFKPALDASGMPVPAPYVVMVQFRLSDD